MLTYRLDAERPIQPSATKGGAEFTLFILRCIFNLVMHVQVTVDELLVATQSLKKVSN